VLRRHIFISYRRDDVRATALALQDRLARGLGPSRVFMDIDHLRPGTRFDRALQKALRQTGVLIAVIGPDWLSILKQRAEQPEPDYVRMEIAGALKSGVDVLPLLVDGAALPHAADLPDDLKDLPAHQKHTVAFETFGRDVDALVKALKAKFTFWRRARRAVAAAFVIGIVYLAAMNWDGVSSIAEKFAPWQSVPEADQADSNEPRPETVGGGWEFPKLDELVDRRPDSSEQGRPVSDPEEPAATDRLA